MKKILSCTQVLIALFIATAISLGVYAYMLLRPISLGMAYNNETEYDGVTFEGTIKFRANKTMVTTNTNPNYEEDFETVNVESRYYYKNGYVFFTMAQTDEEYEEEVAAIKDDFDGAINTPFYADEISAFKLTISEGDDYSVVYTCTAAIVFAIVGGIVELALVALICTSFVLRKKKEDQQD